MMIEDNRRLIDDSWPQVQELVEKTLERAPEFGEFRINSLFSHDFDNYDYDLYEKLEKVLIHYQYIESISFHSYTRLTNLGLHVKKMGGHNAYIDYIKAKNEALELKEKAEYENLIHSTKVNKYLYKTRWLPHALAFVAVAVSVWALIESKKEKVPENNPKSEMPIKR